MTNHEESGKRKPAPEQSDGGSTILRYSEEQWASPEVGIADQRVARFREMRDAEYQRRFGEPRLVSHEMIPLIPHIDVMEYYRVGKLNGVDSQICALVTSGMSDLAMTTPPKASARRVELIFYCSEPKQEYIDQLRWLAHFPHTQKSWVGAFHTMPLKPLWGSPILDTIFFLPPIVKKDQNLHESLNFDGDEVHFLWVVPITSAECKLKLAKGSNALLDLFGQNRHPHIFNPSRKSYV